MSFEATFQDKEIREFLNNIANNTKKASEYKDEYISLISAKVFQDIISHFEQEQGSEGKWPKLNDSYAKYKKKIGKENILQLTGRLRNSFKPTNNRTTTKGIVWFNDAKTDDGTPYAYEHNEGVNQKKREFMWLSDSKLEEIANETLAFILEKDL